MATAHAKRVRALGTRVRQSPRSSANASRKSKSHRQDAIYLRVADIEAALDLVKASVRLAAPEFAAAVIGPERAGVNRFFGAFRLVPPQRSTLLVDQRRSAQSDSDDNDQERRIHAHRAPDRRGDPPVG